MRARFVASRSGSRRERNASPDCLRSDGRVGSEAVVGPRWERPLGDLANDPRRGAVNGATDDASDEWDGLGDVDHARGSGLRQQPEADLLVDLDQRTAGDPRYRLLTCTGPEVGPHAL